MTDELTPDDLPQPEKEGDVPVETLDVDGENPNEMNDDNFGTLCERMRKQGWLGGAILADTDGTIADGEHRWRAAQDIGLVEVPVKFYDWTDAQRRMVRLEMNKNTGDHDRKRDALEYDFLLDAGMSDEVQRLTRAAGEDLDELLAEIKLEASRPAAYDYDPEHNVYFEDCVEGMQERVEDDSVDCVITDPPYGIDYDGDKLDFIGGRWTEDSDSNTIKNDETEDISLELFDRVLSELGRVVKPDGHIYVFTGQPTYTKFRKLIEDSAFELRNTLTWHKAPAQLPQVAQKPTYMFETEWVLFAIGREPATRTIPNDAKEVFECNRADIDKDIHGHPHQKPLKLLSEYVQNSTSKGDTILDPFMGSGSTAVAAIQNDRDYVGFEIDADNYRSVIERRIGEAKRAKDASVNQEEAPADD